MFRVTSFLLALVGLFFAQVVVAQDDFQFTYSIGKTKYEFQLSIFSMDLKELKGAVKNTFEKNQKMKGSTAYWAESTRKGAGKEKYYVVLEYKNLEEDMKETATHLYNEKGKWLYSLLPVPAEDKQFWGEIQGVLRQYATDDADFANLITYKVKSETSNMPQYVIEFGYTPLKEAYTPNKNNFEDTAFRLLLDKNKKVLHEVMLFGNGSELFELNFVAPIFVK